MVDLLRAAVRRLRSRGRRGLLAAIGIVLAGAMAGASVTVAYGLHTGFDRAAARADLPDVIATFDPQDPARIGKLLRALPNTQDVTLRTRFENERISGGTGSSRKATVTFVDPAQRQGYAIVAGRDLRGAQDGVVIEQGLANAWGLSVGDRLDFDRQGSEPIRGIAVAPDNVAFPLAAAPRVYMSSRYLSRLIGRPFPRRIDQALVWTSSAANTDITLQQARATASGVQDLRFVTRAGVRVLIDGAAGIVVALLVAFSLVALGAAGVMLAAQASADVQRQLGAIGVQRAIGVRRGRVAAEHALAAGMLGLVAGGIGVVIGALALRGPSADLLAALSEVPPGLPLVGLLVAAVVAIVALVAAAAGVPAWRAAGRSPVALLRGAELRGRTPKAGIRGGGAGARAGASRPGTGGGALGWLGLGARLALARRGRAALSIGVLAASASLVLLMLGLASLVISLRDDPGSLGKRYSLTVTVPGTSQAEGLRELRGVRGVEAASPRYEVQGVDSYALGEPVRLIAFPGDHTDLEDPPLDEGRRIRGPGEVEVGTGLASALGVRIGGVLAVQLPDGGEARFRVVGTVRALETNGRVAYVMPQRLLDASPGLEAPYAVRLDPDADPLVVNHRLRAIGARPTAVGGATTQSGPLLATLAALLRAVAIIDVLVCLYALGQALALTARERRPTLSLLRATGAPGDTVLLILLGAALVLALPAALLAIPIERLLLAPLVANLAAGYAELGGGATVGQCAAVVAGFAVLAGIAALLVARRVNADPPVAGLREE